MLSLPVDIQILILPFLNFTTLISVSQTNRHFRQLIDPQKEHFIGRLLELECLPKNGGEISLDPHTINPPTILYTCTRCLKLLPHAKFDNHSLLRFRYRKPAPDSPAASQPCNWISGDAKARGRHRQALLRADESRPSPPLGWHPDMPDITEYRNVTSRYRRTCNSCRFETGFWGRNVDVRAWGLRNANSNVGTATVPVIKNRQRVYHDASERFFPGLFPYNEQHPSLRRIYRERELAYATWTLYSVRCPRCEVWREFAAFQRSTTHKACPRDAYEWDVLGWDPRFEEWRCNWCVTETVGKDELGKRLLGVWKYVTGVEIMRLEFDVKIGWGAIDEAEWIKVFKKARVESQLWRKIPTPDDIQKIEDPAKRREYFTIWRKYLQSQGRTFPAGIERGTFEMGGNPWLRRWCEEYEIMEKRIEFFKDCTKKVEVDPGILVEYALRGDSYVEM